jgi:riboflavin kinase/FMN adenylyltransferase
MKVFRAATEGEIIRPTALTLGVFDGLHLGHQLIMNRVVERARKSGLCPTVVTFDPHPRALLHPETAPPLLHTFEQKTEGLSRLGIEQVVVLSFTAELANERAEDFLLQTIFGHLDAREVYLGHGFAFGHNREGRFPLLKEIADRMGRVAEEVPEVTIRGRRVSSTMVRRLLSAGRVNLARRMLGRPYGIEGRVVEGRRAGRAQLSYATANMRTVNCVVPANGVYITLTLIDGEWRRSITNVGHRPTFGGDPEVVIETHILDFDRDIYGEKIRVRFLHRVRGEKKFESIDALRAQIDRDRLRSLRYFSMDDARRNIEFQ